MQILDIVLCVIIGFLGIRGTFRGLVKEIASILGLLLGFVLANSYHAQLSPLLEEYLGGPGLAHLVGYLGIFLGTVAAIFLLATLIRKILKLIRLGWLDSIGGGALGILKGLLLCSIVIMALTAFLPAKSEVLTRSQVVPHINTFNTLLSNALPKEMRDQFLERSQELQKTWEEKIMKQVKETQGSANGKTQL
ncbi:MAG: CvpA family protein [Desulfovibrionales bacterium]|jgi:membrane protein required for colicin V production|nr:CvpA family protein [Desulfovibrionales bacterium]